MRNFCFSLKEFPLPLSLVPPDCNPDFEQPFYILKHTLCPAVLTENLFIDKQEDCAFLLSAKGRQAIIDLRIDGIIAYLSEEEPRPFK